MFSTFTFLSPWILGLLLTLPLLYFLLKASPQKPKVIFFPAVRILQEMSNNHIAATKTPWWLFLIRALLISALIFALADPVNQSTNHAINKDHPIIIIIDNDWSVMDQWEKRKTILKQVVNENISENSPIALIETAQVGEANFLERQALNVQLLDLEAHPWLGDREAVLATLGKLLKKKPAKRPYRIIWISNNQDQEGRFLNALRQLGNLEVMRDTSEKIPSIIHRVERSENGYKLELLHDQSPIPEMVKIDFLDVDNRVLFQTSLSIADKQDKSQHVIDIPTELRKAIERLRITGTTSAASQYLLDEKWLDRPVGIINNFTKNKSLLDPAYYVRKSLAHHHAINEDTLSNLLNQSPSVIFDVNFQNKSAELLNNVQQWIEQGGIYVQFANEKISSLSPAEQNLMLPVPILSGERSFGGALSWQDPQTLEPFEKNTPFQGIDVSAGIEIKKQILARPEFNLVETTWAHLKDGSPLVSAKKIGKGWNILFHVPSVPSWSTLPLSGTFEGMIQRLIQLSLGQNTDDQPENLHLYRLFNQFGQLQLPIKNYPPLSNAGFKHPPSSNNPPGLYGTYPNLKAYNLGPFVDGIYKIDTIPHGVEEYSFAERRQESLGYIFILFALLLLFVDWIINILMMRNVQRASFLLFFMFLPMLGSAQELDQRDVNAANNTQIAYIKTNDPALDLKIEQGLFGLSAVLQRRTSVELAPSVQVNPEKDDLFLYPMLYWAIDDNPLLLSDKAIDKLNTYMKTGGFLLIDTIGQNREKSLKDATKGLDISTLETLNDAHVLTRSFYLLKEFPGRYSGATVWVEKDANQLNDQVSSLLIGQNAWIEAWAIDQQKRPLFAVVPGGETQRENAYRFGINVMMYVLTGNYKADQVHLPAIIERLGQ